MGGRDERKLLEYNFVKNNDSVRHWIFNRKDDFEQKVCRNNTLSEVSLLLFLDSEQHFRNTFRLVGVDAPSVVWMRDPLTANMTVNMSAYWASPISVKYLSSQVSFVSS